MHRPTYFVPSCCHCWCCLLLRTHFKQSHRCVQYIHSTLPLSYSFHFETSHNQFSMVFLPCFIDVVAIHGTLDSSEFNGKKNCQRKGRERARELQNKNIEKRKNLTIINQFSIFRLHLTRCALVTKSTHSISSRLDVRWSIYMPDTFHSAVASYRKLFSLPIFLIPWLFFCVLSALCSFDRVPCMCVCMFFSRLVETKNLIKFSTIGFARIEARIISLATWSGPMLLLCVYEFLSLLFCLVLFAIQRIEIKWNSNFNQILAGKLTTRK